MSRTVLLVLCTVAIILLLVNAAFGARPKVTHRPPSKAAHSVLKMQSKSRSSLYPNEREENKLKNKVVIPDPHTHVEGDGSPETKYAETERRIKEKWAEGDSLDPHELDPNHPSFEGKESYGHDPLLEEDTTHEDAPDPHVNQDDYNGNEQEDSGPGVEESNFTLAIVDLNANNYTSLFNGLHHDIMGQYFIVYGYRKSNCETCAQHMAQFLEVCNTALEAERTVNKHLRHFKCGFWDVDTAKPKDLRYLRSMHSTYHWRAPWVAALPVEEHLAGGHHAEIVDIHFDKFPSDFIHTLRRIKAHKDMHVIVGEHHLMDTVFDSHNDGVTIVLFHDELDTEQLIDKGRVGDYFNRIMHEEKSHIHFAKLLSPSLATAGEGSESHVPPTYGWLEAYNPYNADVVAFLANPNGKEFQTVPFNFSKCDGEWHNFKGILEFREFVDELKGFRHAHTGRRFRGIRKIRHFDILSGENGDINSEHQDPTLSSAEEFGSEEDWRKAQCDQKVEDGDLLEVHLVGMSLDHDKVFLNLTEHSVKVGSVPHLPPIAQHIFVGMCKGQKKDVYIPPHHGFHAEHYYVELLDIISAGGNINDHDDNVDENGVRRRSAMPQEDYYTSAEDVVIESYPVVDGDL